MLARPTRPRHSGFDVADGLGMHGVEPDLIVVSFVVVEST